MSDAVEGEIMQRGVGRPSERTPAIIIKLEAAFNNGFNIVEACQYADITPTTYYRWLGEDDQFSYKMSAAQRAPNIKAKSIIIEAIKAGDTATARWYLDRRDPDFKPKAEVSNTPEQTETRQKIKEFLNDTNDGAYNDASGQPAPADSPEDRGEVANAPTDIS